MRGLIESHLIEYKELGLWSKERVIGNAGIQQVIGSPRCDTSRVRYESHPV